MTAKLTIGLPVRNGGVLLDRALASVAAQTHRPLDVVIADNASDDDTEARCRAFVEAHPFARYVRHERPRSAADNFRFVVDESDGEYFAWAAHDDDRSADFGTALVGALEDDRRTVLAYPTLLIERPGRDDVVRSPLRGDTSGMAFRARARWPWWHSCLPVYGVIRRTALAGYRWYAGNGSPDVPLLTHLAVTGEIVHVPGPTLTYRLVPKRSADLAGNPRLRVARINWDVAGAAADASRAKGERRSRALVFAGVELDHLARRGAQALRRGRDWEPLVGGPA